MEQAEAFVGLQKAIDEVVVSTLDHMCLVVQQVLGVQSGDFAGMHFSGPDAAADLRLQVLNYTVAELENAAGLADCLGQDESPVAGS